MREYGKIHSSFWTSQDIRDMGEDGRTLAAYLLTSPHSNMLGCFRIPPAYVSEDLNWTLERVREGFAKLFEKGFATLSEGSFWVVVHKFLKWNQAENPNVVKAAVKVFDQIPDNCGVKSLLAEALKEYEPRFPIEKLAPFLTLREPFPNPLNRLETGVRKPEPEPEPKPSAPSEKISLNAGGEWIGIPEALSAKWTEAYPAVNVQAELAKAAAWVIANPKNRKSNYARFLTNWLARAQDNARPSRGVNGDAGSCSPNDARYVN